TVSERRSTMSEGRIGTASIRTVGRVMGRASRGKGTADRRGPGPPILGSREANASEGLHMTSPDPVAQAAAYQRYLLAAVGDDDAADVQESTPALLRQLITDAGSDPRRAPADG